MRETWPEGAALGEDGLSIHGWGAAALAERYGTPLIVVDEEHVRSRCRAFGAAFDQVLWAVSAFPSGALLRIALDEGLGLLAATAADLDACLRAGAPADRIALSGGNKLEEEIDRGVRDGVGLLVLDDEEEVERVERSAAGAGRRQPVLLALARAIDDDVDRGPGSGIPLAGGSAPRALKRSLASDHLDVRGVRAELRGSLVDAGRDPAALDEALGFLEEARDASRFEARVLWLEGTLDPRDRDTDRSPAGVAAAVRDALRRGCAERGLRVPAVMVEVGHAIALGAACALYRVGTVKEAPGTRISVAVDGGSSRPARRPSVALASRGSSSPRTAMTVVGREAGGGEVLARDVPLPEDVARGDLLAVAGTGGDAYASGASHRVGRPAVVLVSAAGEGLILRREDAEDLVRLDAALPGVDEVPPPQGIEVRPARPRDVRGVVSLIAEVAGERRFIRTERVLAPPAEFRRRFRRSWTSQNAEIVAVAGKVVAGHLGVSREPGPVVGHVASIGMSVRRPYRGRGVGSALMSEAIRWAREVGVEKLTLSVFPHNVAAIALYRKFGFVEEGRLRAHSKKSYGYEDEVVMARWVS